MEGQLEEVTDWSYYDVPMPEGTEHHLYVIKPTNVGTKKCMQDPCEVLSGALEVPDAGK